MVVVDEAHRHTMEAVDVKKTEGIIVMPTKVPDPPKAGGVKTALEIGKESMHQIAGIVVGSATRRASARRRRLIRTNMDQEKPSMGINNDRTTLRAPNEPETDRVRCL